MSDAKPVLCGNEDHGRPTRALYRLAFPSGRYRSTTACAGCMEWSVRQARDDVYPILIEPIKEAHGVCRECGITFPLRMNGTLRAHVKYGLTACEGRGQKPMERPRPITDVALPDGAEEATK